MEDLNKYSENEQMGGSSSAFINSINQLIMEVKKFIMDIKEFEQPTYTQTQDTKFMMEKYGEAVQMNSKVLDYIRKCEFNISICKDVIASLNTDNIVNQKMKRQVNNLSDRIKNLMDPLYTEEKRMDRILRFYEKTYNTFM